MQKYSLILVRLCQIFLKKYQIVRNACEDIAELAIFASVFNLYSVKNATSGETYSCRF